MTAKTPIYGIEYLIPGEPIRSTRQALENNAKSIEAALANRGVIPPGASDLAALLGRLQTLETRPVFRARRLAAQTLPNGAFPALVWDQKDIDTSAMGTAGATIKLVRTGYYQLDCSLALSGSPGGRAALRVDTVSTTGTVTFGGAAIGALVANGGIPNPQVNASGLVRCDTVGQGIQIAAFQDSGLTPAPTTFSTDFCQTAVNLTWMRGL